MKMLEFRDLILQAHRERYLSTFSRRDQRGQFSRFTAAACFLLKWWIRSEFNEKKVHICDVDFEQAPWPNHSPFYHRLANFIYSRNVEPRIMVCEASGRVSLSGEKNIYPLSILLRGNLNYILLLSNQTHGKQTPWGRFSIESIFGGYFFGHDPSSRSGGKFDWSTSSSSSPP